ncbi:uncharacterized protein LOC106870253 [Octopus bimaculoides]|uniref:uncharacterized protein LOC106870253 n=1 Tax=Octopus bimaculoides TaxID=37653 RepID=UPI0022E5F3A5|nr:uncharacterized protein LOC106870253 [Octopus bimaculoides]
MMCGCHLPAVVNFMKKTYNRSVNVLGKCHKDLGNNQGRKISILDYSQCESRTNSFVFYLIYTKNPHTHRSNGKFNGYKISAENISRAVERELSTMIEKFRVKYCG